MSVEEPQFDPRQVALILDRATQLQHTSTDALSLTQLHEIAAELDLSPAVVSRAVAELGDSRTRPVWWLGGKTALRYEHRVSSAVTEAAFEQMLERLRRCLGNPGQVERAGSARVWSTNRDTSRRVQLTVAETTSPDGEISTTLRLDEQMPSDARLTTGRGVATGFVGGALGLAALSGVVGKVAVAAAVGPILGGFMVAGWVAGRQIWKRRSQGRERDLSQVFGALVELAQRESD